MGGPEVGGVAVSQRRRRKEWQRHIKGSLHDGQGTLYLINQTLVLLHLMMGMET